MTGEIEGQTYTGRTQGPSPEYAPRRKSMQINMGLGGVEPPTSRLSGPSIEIGHVAIRVYSGATPTSRHFRGESKTAKNPSSKRTQRVHTNARVALFRLLGILAFLVALALAPADAQKLRFVHPPANGGVR